MREERRFTVEIGSTSEKLPWVVEGGMGDRDLEVERELWPDLTGRVGIWTVRESLREEKLWDGQAMGGMALDNLRGLFVSERDVAGTMGLGTVLEEGGVGRDLSQGLVFCLRREGPKEEDVDAARRAGNEVR